MKSAVIVAFLLALAWSSPSTAQRRSNLSFAVALGPSIPVGDLGDGSSVGAHGTGMLQMGWRTRTVAYRLEASYSHFWGTSAGRNPDTDIFSLTADVILALQSRSDLSPYLAAGLGYHMFSEACPIANTIGANAGIGVRFSSLFAESRFHLAATDCHSMYHIPVIIGLSFQQAGCLPSARCDSTCRDSR